MAVVNIFANYFEQTQAFYVMYSDGSCHWGSCHWEYSNDMFWFIFCCCFISVTLNSIKVNIMLWLPEKYLINEFHTSLTNRVTLFCIQNVICCNTEVLISNGGLSCGFSIDPTSCCSTLIWMIFKKNLNVLSSLRSIENVQRRTHIVIMFYKVF